MPIPTDPPDDVFDDSHYAPTLGRKLVRAVQLGPKYYLWDLPRYFVHRRVMGLPVWDLGSLINPIREFHPRISPRLELPPGYDRAVARLREAGVRFALPRARLEGLVRVWWATSSTVGDVIECGSYRGATGLFLAVLGREHGLNQTCLLLDTFRGSPAPSRFDGARKASEFNLSSDEVEIIRRQAAALGVAERVKIHAGLFSDTFAALEERPLAFAFAHIDANMYSSTREACDFVLPRMSTGGAVVFDDYNGVCDLGARLAIDRCLRDRPERPQPLAASSAFVRVCR
jgi:predicted O-methyltransferase YrrM